MTVKISAIRNSCAGRAITDYSLLNTNSFYILHFTFYILHSTFYINWGIACAYCPNANLLINVIFCKSE
jgi:hypothetical protein